MLNIMLYYIKLFKNKSYISVHIMRFNRLGEKRNLDQKPTGLSSGTDNMS